MYVCMYVYIFFFYSVVTSRQLIDTRVLHKTTNDRTRPCHFVTVVGGSFSKTVFTVSGRMFHVARRLNFFRPSGVSSWRVVRVRAAVGVVVMFSLRTNYGGRAVFSVLIGRRQVGRVRQSVLFNVLGRTGKMRFRFERCERTSGRTADVVRYFTGYRGLLQITLAEHEQR